jgi:preprotein translocase SecE subunit
MADDENKDGEAADKKAGADVVEASFDDEGSDASDPKAAAPLAERDGELDEEGDEDEEGALPTQMGHRRYVYATFFAFAIAIAYFLSRAGTSLWHRLSQWTPKVGEPREDLMTPVGALLAGIIVLYVYRRPDVRQLSDEVALELSKVEWPTKEKVRRSTTIVVTATLGASLAFWLYDIGANRGVSFVTGSDHPLLYGLAAGVLIYVIRALGSRYLAGKA